MVKNETSIYKIRYKMFQRVEVTELKYNQKYKIIVNNFEYSGIFKGIDVDVNFDKVKFLKNENHDPNIHYFLQKHKYYQFVSQHPQQVMEKRAVNIVLRGILGDEHFEW